MTYKCWRGKAGGKVQFVWSTREAAWLLVEWLKEGTPREQCHIAITDKKLVQTFDLTDSERQQVLEAAAEFI